MGGGGEGGVAAPEKKGEMKGRKRMREKWLTQNLRPNDRVDARKSKKCQMGRNLVGGVEKQTNMEFRCV